VSAVEPTMSTKRAVTTRRSVTGSLIDLPHAFGAETDATGAPMLPRGDWTTGFPNRGGAGVLLQVRPGPGGRPRDGRPALRPHAGGAARREGSPWSSSPRKDLTEEERLRLSGYVQKVVQKGGYDRDRLLVELRDLLVAATPVSG